MSVANIDRFKRTLSELFMFDRADLDFGIYRIMNAKRAEIVRFLDEDLLPQVRTELDKVDSGDRVTLEADLARWMRTLTEAGADPESTPKVQELRARLAATIDVGDVQDRIFSRLADFFARYYKDGDYLPLRRYREGVYALPYEGEEVKLFWANADQYYIKSGEYFRDYAFRLDDGRRVHFKLVSADTDQNNNKPDNDDKRCFILTDDAPVTEDGEELVVRFEYRADPEKRKQAALNAATAALVLADTASNPWRAALAKKEPTYLIKNLGAGILRPRSRGRVTERGYVGRPRPEWGHGPRGTAHFGPAAQRDRGASGRDRDATGREPTPAR